MGKTKETTMRALWRCTGELQSYTKISLDLQGNAVLQSLGMNEQEYMKIKEDLEADYKRKLEALELLWSALRGNASAPAPKDENKTLPSQSLTDIIRQALPKLKEEFSIWEIKQEIERMYPAMKGQYKKNSLSGTLTRMKDRGEITVVQAGEGTAPSIYRRGNPRKVS
jgi:hypothetical protein